MALKDKIEELKKGLNNTKAEAEKATAKVTEEVSEKASEAKTAFDAAFEKAKKNLAEGKAEVEEKASEAKTAFDAAFEKAKRNLEKKEEEVKIEYKEVNLVDIARNVIRGDYGNGDDRVKRLTAAGFDYDRVQGIVNDLLGNTLLAVIHHTVNELCDDFRIVQRVSKNFPLRDISSSRHKSSLLH